MSPETKMLIMVALAVTMCVILVIELSYLRKRNKRKKKGGESFSENAFNIIQTTERICSVLRTQGIDVQKAEELLRDARRFETQREYIIAIEKAEDAKSELMSAKRNYEMLDQPHQQYEEVAESPYQGSTFESDIDTAEIPPPLPTHPDKPPDNYMQAKFMLSTVKDMLDKQEGDANKEAKELYEGASNEFETENYSKALTLAIKAEQLLDTSGNVGLIAETPVQDEIIEEEIVEAEDLECECGAEIKVDDNFCRQCGDKVEFQLICPNCEIEISADDLFCRKCGQKLK